MIKKFDKHFSKKIKSIRIKQGFYLKAALIGDDFNGDVDRLFNHISKLEEGYTPHELRMSIYEGFYLAKRLGLDFDSFMDGNIKPAKTVNEILDYWDPKGEGTSEQRVARLVAHGIITFGRGCEIFDRAKLDGLPEVDTTLCNCLHCRLLIKNKCKYPYE